LWKFKYIFKDSSVWDEGFRGGVFGLAIESLFVSQLYFRKRRKKQMIFGTCHFKNHAAAHRYYRAYGISSAEVYHKINFGEIKIGPPARRHDEEVFLNEKEGRYFKKITDGKLKSR
jgi:hypothetical protein